MLGILLNNWGLTGCSRAWCSSRIAQTQRWPLQQYGKQLSASSVLTRLQHPSVEPLLLKMHTKNTYFLRICYVPNSSYLLSHWILWGREYFHPHFPEETTENEWDLVKGQGQTANETWDWQSTCTLWFQNHYSVTLTTVFQKNKHYYLQFSYWADRAQRD